MLAIAEMFGKRYGDTALEKSHVEQRQSLPLGAWKPQHDTQEKELITATERMTR